MISETTVRIRPVTEADAPALLNIYAPYVLNTAITFEYDVPSAEEFAARIRRITAKYPYLAAEQNGILLGYAYAGPFHDRPAYDWSVETSIYVDKNKKRMGIGRLLHDALENELKKRGFLNMCACIAAPPGSGEDKYLNRDSIYFHEHMGYRMVGEFYQCGYKFGRWYHMVWMEKHIGGHSANPRCPFI